MKNNGSFDDIVSTTTVELPKIDNTINERKTEIDERLKAIQDATDKAATGKDLETIDRIHNLLFSKKEVKPKRSIMNMTDKVKYVIWAVGFCIGLIIGLIVGGITAALISDVNALTGVIGWIQSLIVIVFGGIGLFIASLITDKRR